MPCMARLRRASLFQSTRPHGARPQRFLRLAAVIRVSIHAPARGATVGAPPPGRATGCFNPRARTGRDRAGLVIRCMSLRFQSTRPHGARPKGTGKIPDSKSFNPRARTGRDRPIPCYNMLEYRFQSTRPHGARLQPSLQARPSQRFQSTRPHGARLECGAVI